MPKPEQKSDTARFCLGFEQGVNPVDRLIPGLLSAAEDPKIAKIAVWLLYNPRTILEALSVFDVLNLIQKPTTATVTGESTPFLTLMLQGAKIRRATRNTWFGLSPFAGARISGFKAETFENISTSLVNVDRVAKDIIIQKAGMNPTEEEEYLVDHKLYSSDTASKIGQNGLIDMII